MAIEQKSSIYTLPNEILSQIVNYLPAKNLLPLVSVSHHFGAIIAQVLETRLLSVGSLESGLWVIEFYLAHGSGDHHNDVSFNGEYIDTLGLADKQGEVDLAERLARLQTLYARYKPPPVESSSRSTAEEIGENMVQNSVSVVPNLEEDEKVELFPSFNYYCPKYMTGMEDIVMLEGDYGCLSFLRDWLNERADRHSLDVGDDDGDEGKDDFVWVNGEENVGVRFRVKRRVHENKDCYELFIEGESFEIFSLL